MVYRVPAGEVTRIIEKSPRTRSGWWIARRHAWTDKGNVRRERYVPPPSQIRSNEIAIQFAGDSPTLCDPSNGFIYRISHESREAMESSSGGVTVTTVFRYHCVPSSS